MGETIALVGAVGGAGTTRLTVEFGATLARAGRSVALLDAAYATQGLSGYVRGRIDPDITALATGDGPVESGLIDLDLVATGRLAACPAAAPFERVARAKTPAAAQRLEDLITEAANAFDVTVVDTPPVAANQALAAVNGAERVGLVTPASERGADAYARAVDRLTDIGAPPNVVIANGAPDGGPVDDADVSVPQSEVEAPGRCPASSNPDGRFAPGVAAAVESLLSIDLDLGFDEREGLGRYLPEPLRNP